MSIEEAEKLSIIIATADGGCASCVSSLASELNDHFPGFEWTMPESNDWYSREPRKVDVRCKNGSAQ